MILCMYITYVNFEIIKILVWEVCIIIVLNFPRTFKIIKYTTCIVIYVSYPNLQPHNIKLEVSNVRRSPRRDFIEGLKRLLWKGFRKFQKKSVLCTRSISWTNECTLSPQSPVSKGWISSFFVINYQRNWICFRLFVTWYQLLTLERRVVVLQRLYIPICLRPSSNAVK